MYGLVNQAIRDMVVERFGEEAWATIRDKSGAEDLFLTMEQYPDELTYNMVGAACELLGAEADVVLKTFGEYWVDYVAESYRELFEISGDDFVSFVKNLNSLHTRVAQMMPELDAPAFSVSEEQEGSFVLHYHSRRPGLQPMILGLFYGLGKRFATEVDISYLEGRNEGLDHDRFQVRYSRN